MYKLKKILVTGASGFIGGHIVTALLDRGFSVTAQYRREKIPPHLVEAAERGASLIRADLSEPGALPAILSNTDAVIHAAALAYDWGSPELFRAMNTEPARMLIELSIDAGVRQFIHISSTSVHGFGNHVDTTEEGPYYPLINPYQTSKKEAEDLALAANSPTFAVTVVRPGNVYGPGDTTAMFPIFDAMVKGIWIYVGRGDTLTCPVYVKDLADGICACIGNARANGEVFNLTSGEKATWKELLTEAAFYLGIKRPGKHVPVFLARAAAGVLESLFRLFRSKKAPAATFYRVEQVANNYHFSIKKAAEVLGYQPKIMWPEGIKRTAEDYKSKSQ